VNSLARIAGTSARPTRAGCLQIVGPKGGKVAFEERKK